jgi:hypothetical protein
MLDADNSAAVMALDINGLAELYFAALTLSDVPQAEAVAVTLWDQHLLHHALRQAREHWNEFDAHVDGKEFASLGRERFVAELTSERRESRTVADVHNHILDALHHMTENLVLTLLAARCQRAAAAHDESEYQRCFWVFCAIVWPHVTEKVKQFHRYQSLESEILDEVEHRLRAKLRLAESIEHIFGFLDVVVARAVSSVTRRYQTRPSSAHSLSGYDWPCAQPAQEFAIESQQLWAQLEQWVIDIDRAAGEREHLCLIYHMDLAGRTEVEIAQSLSPPISQGEVSKRMHYLCRELARRICHALSPETRPLAPLPRGWCYRMVEALRELKKNVELVE